MRIQAISHDSNHPQHHVICFLHSSSQVERFDALHWLETVLRASQNNDVRAIPLLHPQFNLGMTDWFFFVTEDSDLLLWLHINHWAGVLVYTQWNGTVPSAAHPAEPSAGRLCLCLCLSFALFFVPHSSGLKAAGGCRRRQAELRGPRLLSHPGRGAFLILFRRRCG